MCTKQAEEQHRARNQKQASELTAAFVLPWLD
jgi:hypothetical protein